MSFKGLDRVMMAAHETYGDDWLLGEGGYAKPFSARWAPIPDPATQPVSMSGCRLPDVANVGDGLRARAAVESVKESFYDTPQPLMCACGKVATRLVGFNTHGCTPMCRECDMTRLVKKAKPEPPPGPTHCGCGASFATVKRFQCVDGGTEEYCGDCWSAKGSAKIDARIRAAREGRDEDPTTWTAGATPGWEWP